MENVIAPENTPPIVSSQPATPAPVVTTPAEDSASELARLRQERIDLDKRLADKDKHINDLSTEKATLETRLSGYQAVDSVIPTEDQEVVQQPAGQPVGAYVRPEDIPEIIERTGFLNKMKDDNKDMMEFGLEPVIAMRADQLIRTGKTFKEAVATAVKEQREKFDKIKAPSTPAPVVPSSLRGEDGSNPPVEQKPEAEEALADEGDERKRMRAKKGL